MFKTKNVIASVNVGMSVDDKNRHHRYAAHFRLWGGILFLVIVACGLGLLIYGHVHETPRPPAKGSAGHSSGVTVDKKQSVDNQSLGLALNGHESAAQTLLDQSIAQASSPAQKAQLYEQKANLAYSAGGYSQALEYAQTADGLDPTATSADLIAISAEAMGNKPLALKYYQLDLQRMKPPFGPGDQQALEAKIQALED